jgi:hypothetical protein
VHFNLGFPKRRVPSGLIRVSLLQGSSPCILQRFPSHLTLQIFITFFFWPYSPWGTSAPSKIVLVWSRSRDMRLQFLTTTFFRSSSTDVSHLNLGFPTRRVPSGLISVSFPQGSSSCTLNRCPSHVNRPVLVTLTMSSSLHSAYSSLLSSSTDTIIVSKITLPFHH